jgi:hypothetical protein
MNSIDAIRFRAKAATPASFGFLSAPIGVPEPNPRFALATRSPKNRIRLS